MTNIKDNFRLSFRFRSVRMGLNKEMTTCRQFSYIHMDCCESWTSHIAVSLTCCASPLPPTYSQVKRWGEESLINELPQSYYVRYRFFSHWMKPNFHSITFIWNIVLFWLVITFKVTCYLPVKKIFIENLSFNRTNSWRQFEWNPVLLVNS